MKLKLHKLQGRIQFWSEHVKAVKLQKKRQRDAAAKRAKRLVAKQRAEYGICFGSMASGSSYVNEASSATS